MSTVAPHSPRLVVPAGDLADEFVQSNRFGPHVAAVREIPSRDARFGDWPEVLDPAVTRAASNLGIERPYAYQATAIATAMAPGTRAVAVAAGTASGKSLCYAAPIVNSLLKDDAATALLLFPTKALAHDQLKAFQRWDAALEEPALAPAAYDGDTPVGARAGVRHHARVLFSNPDMLHAGILPRHPSWGRFLSGLRWVVIDEMHVYRGVFGGHVANVLRRLRRVAAFHGASFRFVLTSATIANPAELGRHLTGAETMVVEEDGAPRGLRRLIFYNPPVIDQTLNIRRGAVVESERVAGHFIAGGVQTIVFARTRQAAELLVRYIGEQLPSSPGDEPLIRGYRGGYRPAERRAIEAALRDGRLRAVVATNALELGIDIGELDACVMTGYPGTIASTWQQAGRAGRRGETAVAVMVASGAPLDQFIVRHPDWLMGRSPEHARLDPDNLLLLMDHIRCAAYELPFSAAEAAVPFGQSLSLDDGRIADDVDRAEHDTIQAAGDGRVAPAAASLLAVLAAQGTVNEIDGRWYWLSESDPAGSVSLRTNSADNVTIVHGVAPRDASDSARADGEVLGTVGLERAPAEVHEGAVYLHDGDAWRVTRLDWEARRAYVETADGATYTRAGGRTDVTPLNTAAIRPAAGVEVAHGELEVRSLVTGYRVLRFHTNETVSWGRVDLPEQVHVAGGCWFTLNEATVDELRAIGRWSHGAPDDRGPSWLEQRRRALERDDHRCRHCAGTARPGSSLDVHHIRPFKSFGWQPGENDAHRAANDVNNLISLCKSCHAAAERALGLHGALTAVGYAVGHIAPFYLMCDAADLGVSSVAHAAWSGRPTVVVFERAAGGVGFGEALFRMHETVLSAARSMIADCPCATGCPSCVGPADAMSVDAKIHALTVLAKLT